MRYGGYDLQKASKASAPTHHQGSFQLKKVQNTACQIMGKFNTKLHCSLKKLYLNKANASLEASRNSPLSFRGSLFDSENSSGHIKRIGSLRYDENDFRPHFDMNECKDHHNYIFGTNVYNFSARNILNGKSTIKILNTFKEIEESNSLESIKSAKNSLQRLKDERKTIFKELLELSSCDESLEYRLVKDYLECNSYSEIENDTEFKEYLQRKNYTDILSYLNDCHEPKSLTSISSSIARAQSALGKASLNSLKVLSIPKSLKEPKKTPEMESHVCHNCRSAMRSFTPFNQNATLKAPRHRGDSLEDKPKTNIFSSSYRDILKFCHEFFEESFKQNNLEMPKFTFNKFKEQKYEQILKDFVMQQGYERVQDYVEDKFGKFIEHELSAFCKDLKSSAHHSADESCDENCSECVKIFLRISKRVFIFSNLFLLFLCNDLKGYCDQMHSEEMIHLVPASLQGKEDILFGNLRELYTFHNDVFLKDLENCISTTELVALCFVQRRDTFYRLYSFYCQNIPRSDRLRETLVDTHLFLQECQKRLGHKLPLAAYLLKPVQRITKYQLLLKDLLRFSDSGSCTKELQKALDCMLIVLKCVNDSMHQVAITGFPTDLSQQGELLLQDSFQVWSESKKDIRLRIKPQQRHIFLYQKSMLFCKQTSKPGHNKSTYQFKNYLKMSQIGLTESVRGDTKRFEVWLQGRQEVHTLQAPTIEIKNKWVAEIKRVLLNQLEELKGEKIKQYGLNHRGLRQTTSWDTPNIITAQRTISCDASSESSNRNSNCSSSDDNCITSGLPISSNMSMTSATSTTDKEHNNEACGWSSDYSNSEDEMSVIEDNSTPRFINFLAPWSTTTSTTTTSSHHHNHQHHDSGSYPRNSKSNSKFYVSVEH